MLLADPAFAPRIDNVGKAKGVATLIAVVNDDFRILESLVAACNTAAVFPSGEAFLQSQALAGELPCYIHSNAEHKWLGVGKASKRSAARAACRFYDCSL
jgi:hypothetical protein